MLQKVPQQIPIRPLLLECSSKGSLNSPRREKLNEGSTHLSKRFETLSFAEEFVSSHRQLARKRKKKKKKNKLETKRCQERLSQNPVY